MAPSQIRVVSGDTELISAPAYLKAAAHAPRLQSYVSVIGIIQDELGHAHIAYRMLRDLGVDTDTLIYEREPSDFRHPYSFDVPLESWAEMVVANGFYDRAWRQVFGDDAFYRELIMIAGAEPPVTPQKLDRIIRAGKEWATKRRDEVRRSARARELWDDERY